MHHLRTKLLAGRCVSRTRALVAHVLFAATLAACATTHEPSAQAPAVTGPTVELTLARADTTLFSLTRQRAGRPTLLFLFATYDTASQVALAHLERFLSHDARVATLGIALQPDARSFLDIYRDALDVDFPLAYDPEGSILEGTSDLGRIKSVPTFVILDAIGQLRATHTGVANEEELDALVTRALE